MKKFSLAMLIAMMASFAFAQDNATQDMDRKAPPPRGEMGEKGQRPQRPEGQMGEKGQRPQRPEGEMGKKGQRPQRPEGEMGQRPPRPEGDKKAPVAE